MDELKYPPWDVNMKYLEFYLLFRTLNTFNDSSDTDGDPLAYHVGQSPRKLLWQSGTYLYSFITVQLVTFLFTHCSLGERFKIWFEMQWDVNEEISLCWSIGIFPRSTDLSCPFPLIASHHSQGVAHSKRLRSRSLPSLLRIMRIKLPRHVKAFNTVPGTQHPVKVWLH